MKDFYRKHRRALWVIGLVFAAAAIVWAAAELSGQANSMAADAGSNSGDMEMTTINTVKKPVKTKEAPQGPPCDWAKERQLKSAIGANDAKYKQLSSKAKSEARSAGKVSAGTKSAVQASAREFKSLCDQYAAMWDACKCFSRGKTARKTGDSRIKSAEVLVSEIDESKLNQMQSAQDEMKAARRDYVQTATDGAEISDADKADLKSTALPQAQALLGQSESLVKGVTDLLGTVTKGASGGVSGLTSGGIGGLTDIAKSASSGGAGTAVASAGSSLLKPVQALLSVAKSMFDGVKSLISDIQTLITGSAGVSSLTGGGPLKSGPCFVGSSDE